MLYFMLIVPTNPNAASLLLARSDYLSGLFHHFDDYSVPK